MSVSKFIRLKISPIIQRSLRELGSLMDEACSLKDKTTNDEHGATDDEHGSNSKFLERLNLTINGNQGCVDQFGATTIAIAFSLIILLNTRPNNANGRKA